MAKGLSKKPLTKAEVKAAADRAEARAKGKSVEPATSPLNPPEDARGRPPKYRPEFAVQAEKLCMLGATDEEIADFFNVSVRTVYRWKGEHEAFCQALKSGKSVCDERVERSLYQKAVGYEIEAVKIFMPAGASEPVYAKYREKIAADTTAAIFWLKNRRSKEWKDVKHNEHGGPGDFTNMTDEEIVNEIERLTDAEIANMHDGNGTVN
jgi:hypothetical protein